MSIQNIIFDRNANENTQNGVYLTITSNVGGISDNGVSITELLQYASDDNVTFSAGGVKYTQRGALGSEGFIHNGNWTISDQLGANSERRAQDPFSINMGSYNEILLFLSRAIRILPGATLYVDVNCSLYFSTTYNTIDLQSDIDNSVGPRVHYLQNPIRQNTTIDDSGILGVDYFQCLGNIELGRNPYQDYSNTPGFSGRGFGDYGAHNGFASSRPRLRISRVDNSATVKYDGKFNRFNSSHLDTGSHSMFAIANNTYLSTTNTPLNSIIDMSGCTITTAYTIGSGGADRNITTSNYTEKINTTTKFNGSTVQFGLNANTQPVEFADNLSLQQIKDRRDSRRTQFQVRHGNWELDDYNQFGGSLVLSIPPTKAKGINLFNSVLECHCDFPTNIILENLKLNTAPYAPDGEDNDIVQLGFVNISAVDVATRTNIVTLIDNNINLNDIIRVGDGGFKMSEFGSGVTNIVKNKFNYILDDKNPNISFTTTIVSISSDGRSMVVKNDGLNINQGLLENVPASITQNLVTKTHDANSHITFGTNTSSLILRNFDLTHPEHRSIITNQEFIIEKGTKYGDNIVFLEGGINNEYPTNGVDDSGHHRGTIVLNRELKFRILDETDSVVITANVALVDNNENFESRFSTTTSNNIPVRLSDNSNWEGVSGNSVIHNWADVKEYRGDTDLSGIATIRLLDKEFGPTDTTYLQSATNPASEIFKIDDDVTHNAFLPDKVRSAVDGIFTHVMQIPPDFGLDDILPSTISALKFEDRTPFKGTVRSLGYFEEKVNIDLESIIQSKDAGLIHPIVLRKDPLITSTREEIKRVASDIKTLKDLYESIKLKELELFEDDTNDSNILNISDLVTNKDNEIIFPTDSILTFNISADQNSKNIVDITIDSSATPPVKQYTFNISSTLIRYTGINPDTPDILEFVDTIVVPRTIEEVISSQPLSPFSIGSLVNFARTSGSNKATIIKSDLNVGPGFTEILQNSDVINITGIPNNIIYRIDSESDIISDTEVILTTDNDTTSIDAGAATPIISVSDTSAFVTRNVLLSENFVNVYGIPGHINTSQIIAYAGKVEILPFLEGQQEEVTITSSKAYNIKVYRQGFSSPIINHQKKNAGESTGVPSIINDVLKIYAWQDGGFDPIFIEYNVINSVNNQQTIDLQSYFPLSENRDVLTNIRVGQQLNNLSELELDVFTEFADPQPDGGSYKDSLFYDETTIILSNTDPAFTKIPGFGDTLTGYKTTGYEDPTVLTGTALYNVLPTDPNGTIQLIHQYHSAGSGLRIDSNNRLDRYTITGDSVGERISIVGTDGIEREFFAKFDLTGPRDIGETEANIDHVNARYNLFLTRNFDKNNGGVTVNTKTENPPGSGNFDQGSVFVPVVINKTLTRYKKVKTFGLDYYGSKTYASRDNLASAFNMFQGTDLYFSRVDDISRKLNENVNIKLIDIIRIGESYGILIDSKLRTNEGPNFTIRNNYTDNSVVVYSSFMETTPTDFTIETVLSNCIVIYRTDASGIDLNILGDIIASSVGDVVGGIVQPIINNSDEKLSKTIIDNGIQIP